MATVFIDESGDLGVRGNRFFVIATVIPQNKKRLDNIVKHHCAANGVVEIKSSLLTFPAKQALLRKLSSVDDYSVTYVVADKNHIDPALFRDKNILYNYIFQYAVKPTIKAAAGNIHIVVDNHSTKVASRNSLADYVKTKAFFEWGVKHGIQIKYEDSKVCRAIQIADLVANTIYGKYLYDKNHLYDMLKIDRSIKFPHGKFNT